MARRDGYPRPPREGTRLFQAEVAGRGRPSTSAANLLKADTESPAMTDTIMPWILPGVSIAGLAFLLYRHSPRRAERRAQAVHHKHSLSLDRRTHDAAVELIRRLAQGEQIVQGLHGTKYVVGSPPRVWERADRDAVAALRDSGLIEPVTGQPRKAWRLSHSGRVWHHMFLAKSASARGFRDRV